MSSSSQSIEDPPSFVSIPLEVARGAVDRAGEFVAEPDALKKTGRFGAIVAKHRREFICISLALIAIGISTLAVGLLSGAASAIAAGLSHGTLHEARTTVTRDDGTSILNVVEPVERMSTPFHALILYNHLTDDTVKKAAARTPAVAVVRDQRYAAWPVSHGGLHNFTFDALEARLVVDLKSNEQTCNCFAEYGVPLNAVVCSIAGAEPEIIYGAKVDHETCSETAKGSQHSPLLQLMKLAGAHMSSMSKASMLPVEISASELAAATNVTSCPHGIVEGVRSNGRKTRVTLQDSALREAKACIRVFE